MLGYLWKAGWVPGLGLMSQFAFAGSKWELVSEKAGIKGKFPAVRWSPFKV